MTERARTSYLDRVKVALTALVIVHHLAITYGASGSWYYRDPSAPDSLALSIVAGIDQAFFMGLFFFVSGYFTPGSLDRKGPGRFLVDRVFRLLVPALAFAVAIAPGLEYVKRTSLGVPTPSLLAYYPQRLAEWRELDPGPLWFVWALFVFDVGYVLWRGISRPPAAAPHRRDVTTRDLAAVAAAIAILTIAIRLCWPIGESVAHIQVAYLPQYVVMFGAGIGCARRRNLDDLPGRLAWVGAAAAVSGLATWIAAGASADGHLDRILGGSSAPAALYGVGESGLCVGLSLAVLVGFQRRFASSGRVGRVLAEGAFATYVVHAPIIVVLALALTPLAAPALVKLAVAVVVAVPGCFAIGFAAHRTPVLSSVL